MEFVSFERSRSYLRYFGGFRKGGRFHPFFVLFLSWRPGQRTPGQQMEVDMKYCLPRVGVAVEHRSVAVLRMTKLMRDQGRSSYHAANHGVVLG